MILTLHHFNFIKQSKLNILSYGLKCPTYRFDKSFRIANPSRDDWQHHPPNSNCKPASWYSDESVSELAGSGLHCAQANVETSIPLGRFAETAGIFGCCHELSNSEGNVKPIHIFTISQVTLKA